MESQDLLNLLQMCDSAFPTGGFSHSLGLEACIQNHNRQRKADMKTLYSTFICILENAGSFGVPLIKSSHSANGDSKILNELDEFCEACSCNHVSKRASIKQGASLRELALTVFEDLHEDFKTSLNSLPYCHYPIVFGLLLSGLGYSQEVTEIAFMFSTARTIIASAIRLDVIGPMEGQKTQARMQQLIPDIQQRNQHRTVDDVCIKFPIIDIFQNTQDTIFCKLFYS